MDINVVFPNAIAENLKGVIVPLYGMIPMMSLSMIYWTKKYVRMI